MENLFQTKNNLEQQKQKFDKQLKEILNSQITTENINNFANTALNKLITLNEEITANYQAINPEKLSGKQLEDQAYEFYKIDKIDDLLTKINEKSKQIKNINLFIIQETKKDPRIFVPPDKLTSFNIAKGDHDWDKKKIIPRLITLLYLLENDFNIQKENIKLTEGLTLNSQMRKEPYFRIEIEQLNRLVYICIEQENVTYVFDQQELNQLGIQIESLDEKSKDERRKILTEHPHLGTKINQSKYWRERISNLLSSEYLNYFENNSEKEIKPIFDLQEQEPLPKTSTDKNDEWYGFYTDENGDHWGTSEALCAKLKISIGTYKKLKKEYKDQLKTKLVTTTKNAPFHLHSLENIQKICNVQKYHQYEKINTKGSNDWPGFTTDENGEHWGSLRSISQKLKANGHKISYGTLKNYISNKNKNSSDFNFEQRKIRDHRNIEITIYKYKDIENATFVKEKISIPQSAKTDNEELNQLANFYTDEHGTHWGTIRAIAEKLSTYSSTLTNAIKKTTIKPIDIIDAYGHLQKNGGYPLEKIKKIFHQ